MRKDEVIERVKKLGNIEMSMDNTRKEMLAILIKYAKDIGIQDIQKDSDIEELITKIEMAISEEARPQRPPKPDVSAIEEVTEFLDEEKDIKPLPEIRVEGEIMKAETDAKKMKAIYRTVAKEYDPLNDWPHFFAELKRRLLRIGMARIDTEHLQAWIDTL